MFKKLINYLLIPMVSIVAFLIWTQPSVVQASGAGFTISANIPDNQYDDDTSNFDLVMQPGQKQTLSVTVENLENDTKTLTASANTSYTSAAGNTAYDKFKLGELTTAEYRFNQIFDAPQKVQLKPYETKKVNFQLTMPKETYRGILEGALYFKDETPGKKQPTNQEGFTMTNYYAMAIGVILREHPDTHVQPDLKLRRIRVSQHNHLNEPAVLAKLENIQPATAGKMKITAKVSKKKGSKTLYGYQGDNYTMATKSHFEYAIPLGNAWLNPGKYHLRLVATSAQHQWVFERDFEISYNTAMKMNRNNKNLWWIWLIIIIIILFILIILLTYYLGYRRHKKQAEKKEKQQLD